MPTSSSITVAQADAQLTAAARNVSGNSDYPKSRRHAAIQFVLTDLISYGSFSRVAKNFVLQSGLADFDLSTNPDFGDFRASLIRESWIDCHPVNHTSHSRLRMERKQHGDGRPCSLGFYDQKKFVTDRKTDIAYTLTVVFKEPLVYWPLPATNSDTTSDNVVINLPIDVVIYAVQTGGVAALQRRDVENVRALPDWQLYTTWRDDHRGDGGTGDQVGFSSRPSDQSGRFVTSGNWWTQP